MGAVITPLRGSSLARAISSGDWHLPRARGWCWLLFSAPEGERPPLCLPSQLSSEPREGAPAGLSESVVWLLSDWGASRAAGRSRRSRTLRRRPLSCFRPCLLCRRKLSGAAPGPLPIGPRCHVSAISWGQPGLLAVRRGVRGASAAAGGTDPTPRWRGRHSDPPRAASFLLACGMVGLLLLPAPLFYILFYTPI